MALPVIENVYRVTWNFTTYQGITPRIINHYFVATGSEADLVTALDSNKVNGMFAPMNTGFTPASIDVLPLNGTSPTSNHTLDLTSWEPCEGTGEPVPEACYILTLHTGQRGPRGRGRMFIGPASESNIDSGLVTGEAPEDLQGAWVDFMEAITGDGVELVVASYVNEDFNTVLGTLVQPYVGMQRRRLLQVRP